MTRIQFLKNHMSRTRLLCRRWRCARAIERWSPERWTPGFAAATAHRRWSSRLIRWEDALDWAGATALVGAFFAPLTSGAGSEELSLLGLAARALPFLGAFALFFIASHGLAKLRDRLAEPSPERLRLAQEELRSVNHALEVLDLLAACSPPAASRRGAPRL